MILEEEPLSDASQLAEEILNLLHENTQSPKAVLDAVQQAVSIREESLHWWAQQASPGTGYSCVCMQMCMRVCLCKCKFMCAFLCAFIMG